MTEYPWWLSLRRAGRLEVGQQGWTEFGETLAGGAVEFVQRAVHQHPPGHVKARAVVVDLGIRGVGGGRSGRRVRG